ncbi:MAG: copper amine oxidase N-terminal domain-containing protein, partial [Limnochordia bacterium]
MTKQKFAGKALLLLVVLMVAAAGTIKADDGQRSDLESMRRQVDLLQRAFAPKTPQEAVEKWAAAVKARNGAAQFAVLSPRLRQNLQSEFEALMWV